jgi:hypothetical protein
VTFVDWDDMPRWGLIDKALDLGYPEPVETYSSSPHLFSDLDIPEGTKGRLPRAAQTRAGLDAEALEDLGETGKHTTRAAPRPDGRRSDGGRSGERSGSDRGDDRGGRGAGRSEAESRRERGPRRERTVDAGGARAATPPAEPTRQPAPASDDATGAEGSKRRSRGRRRTRGGGGTPAETQAAATEG